MTEEVSLAMRSMIETTAPGGQAGSSSKIENYLGFPTGISGQQLATSAIVQAEKFGARMMVAHRVVRLECDSRSKANKAKPRNGLTCHYNVIIY